LFAVAGPSSRGPAPRHSSSKWDAHGNYMGDLDGPNAPGVTLQLFTDPTCVVNISTPDTLDSPINQGCLETNNQSYNLTCRVDNTGVTNFDYSAYNVPGCKGDPLTAIRSNGKGKCLPTVVISNGQPVPLTLYATVSCNNVAVDIIEDETSSLGDDVSIATSHPGKSNHLHVNRKNGRKVMHFARKIGHQVQDAIKKDKRAKNHQKPGRN